MPESGDRRHRASDSPPAAVMAVGNLRAAHPTINTNARPAHASRALEAPAPHGTQKAAPAAMSISFPKEEERILALWKEIDAFQRQVELSKGKQPYTFYDGPPFATGLPHYGHLLASTIKDIIPRYWSMKGRYVERRFGWDTHGVPIEHEIDKKLGMSGKDAVAQLGLAKYNEECRAIVMRFASEWRQTIDRLGRWIDFDNDYKVRAHACAGYVSC